MEIKEKKREIKLNEKEQRKSVVLFFVNKCNFSFYQSKTKKTKDK